MTVETFDHVIVGGGIAGLYCAYHLQKRGCSNIALFESSDRLGGRIETWRIDPKEVRKTGGATHVAPDKMGTPGTDEYLIAEFGPMRIEPDHQPYLKRLLDELGFRDAGAKAPGTAPEWTDLVPFTPYQSPALDQPLFKLDDEEAGAETLMDLLLLALRRICETLTFPGGVYPWAGSPTGDQKTQCWKELRQTSHLHRRFWKRRLMDFIRFIDEGDYANIHKTAQFRGIDLQDLGFWNVVSSVMTHMAATKLRDWGSFFHLLPENPNAATWLIFWFRVLQTSNALRGIRGGMDLITHKLEMELSSIKIHKNHHLESIDLNEDANLSFSSGSNTVSYKASKDIILAIPKHSIQPVQFYPKNTDSDLQVIFESVSAVPLLKCFFVVDAPFWSDARTPNTYANTTPTRELHYWKTADRRTGLLMVYTDRPSLKYWEALGSDYHKYKTNKIKTPEARQDKATLWGWNPASCGVEYFQNEPLLRTFLLYAKEEGADEVTADRLLAAGMRNWGLRPYEGAFHVWRPKCHPEGVMDYLAEFSLNGSSTKLHVCGEAYSDYQGFIEGALRSAACVLNKISCPDSSQLKDTNTRPIRSVKLPGAAPNDRTDPGADSASSA